MFALPGPERVAALNENADELAGSLFEGNEVVERKGEEKGWGGASEA